jgi:hypothetical protein
MGIETTALALRIQHSAATLNAILKGLFVTMGKSRLPKQLE